MFYTSRHPCTGLHLKKYLAYNARMLALCMFFYCFILELYGFIQPNTSLIIRAYRGNTVLLDCRFNTTFLIEGVIWAKDGASLQTTNNSRMIDLPNGTLIIVELNDSDIGNYTCEVVLFRAPKKRRTLIVEMIPDTGM